MLLRLESGLRNGVAVALEQNEVGEEALVVVDDFSTDAVVAAAAGFSSPISSFFAIGDQTGNFCFITVFISLIVVVISDISRRSRSRVSRNEVKQVNSGILSSLFNSDGDTIFIFYIGGSGSPRIDGGVSRSRSIELPSLASYATSYSNFAGFGIASNSNSFDVSGICGSFS